MLHKAQAFSNQDYGVPAHIISLSSFTENITISSRYSTSIYLINSISRDIELCCDVQDALGAPNDILAIL